MTSSSCCIVERRFIDALVFGERHMYHASLGPFVASAASCGPVYLCNIFDPEGVLGSLMATVLVFTGVHAGRILLLYRRVRLGTLLFTQVLEMACLNLRRITDASVQTDAQTHRHTDRSYSDCACDYLVFDAKVYCDGGTTGNVSGIATMRSVHSMLV